MNQINEEIINNYDVYEADENFYEGIQQQQLFEFIEIDDEERPFIQNQNEQMDLFRYLPALEQPSEDHHAQDHHDIIHNINFNDFQQFQVQQQLIDFENNIHDENFQVFIM